MIELIFFIVSVALAAGYALGRWHQEQLEDQHWRSYGDFMKGQRQGVSRDFDRLRHRVAQDEG